MDQTTFPLSKIQVVRAVIKEQKDISIQHTQKSFEWLFLFQCPKCSAPRVLPTDPLDDQSPWECVACGNYSVSASSVDLLLRRLGDEAEAIDASDIPTFEKFLVRYAKLLPPKLVKRSSYIYTTTQFKIVYMKFGTKRVFSINFKRQL